MTLREWGMLVVILGAILGIVVGLTGCGVAEAGRSPRLVLYISTDTEDRFCDDQASCCPEGFAAVGRNERAVVCLEE